jgi:hypothetical protein
MRTTINIDDDLLAKAIQLMGSSVSQQIMRTFDPLTEATLAKSLLRLVRWGN